MDEILPFKDPPECDGIQLTVLTGIYGYVLFTAAGLIGDGSELLLLIPAYADIVGSVVLPVLGAVPDGMIVLFSGLGDRFEAQEQVTVGVGALAGSTIMLLTLAWFAGVWGGRVNLEGGKPDYASKPKLNPPNNRDPNGTGIRLDRQLNDNSWVMMCTSLLYLVVQIPAFRIPSNDKLEEESLLTNKSVFDIKADAVNGWALLGFLLCFLSFLIYLYLQTLSQDDSDSDELAKNMRSTIARQTSIRNGEISLRGAMYGLLGDKSGSLLHVTEKEKLELKRLLKPFFEYYDLDKSRCLNRLEFAKILRDLHEDVDPAVEDQLFASADVDRSGFIDFNEFVSLMCRYLKDGKWEEVRATRIASQVRRIQNLQDSDDDDESSEEDEMPDDLRDLSPQEQQRAIFIRACLMMGVGTLLVLIFSDPAVKVLSEIGARTGISPFYVSFVLAPLASNASELIATYRYGCKKTIGSMTIALSTLEGAACMNNTFCLMMLYLLVWKQRLVWNCSSEVLSILLVEFIVGTYALKSVQTLADAYHILALFPASIVFVWFMVNIVGIP